MWVASRECYFRARQQVLDRPYANNVCKCSYSCYSVEYAAKIGAIKLNMSAIAAAKGSNANYSDLIENTALSLASF